MSSRIKLIIGLVIIAVFITVGFISFMGSTIEYVDFKEAQNRMRTVEVKGYWMKEKGIESNAAPFVFYMKDDKNTEMKVVHDGAKPNNFEVAEAIVVKGKMEKDGSFHAKDILTKCPSKYEAKGNEVKETGK